MSSNSYGAQRWDTDRFTRESIRYDEARSPRRTGGFRPRSRDVSVDEEYERRVSGPQGYEDDRFRERVHFEEDGPRYRPRRESVTIEKEKEREVYSPSPPRRAPVRPGLIRRQSSLDTFDRRPFPRYQREEYGPPARREDVRPAYVPPPVPRPRALPPPRRYAEREFEEIKISEPDYYGDEEYRPYPERVREREIIRSRRRSRSRSPQSRRRSISSSSSSSSEVVIEKKYPRRGKTRMPARLVSVKAIVDLGYPYEVEAGGNVVIIQKALGPENIDEVIKLSETYKKYENLERAKGKLTNPEEIEMSGGRGGEVIEERREEVVKIPIQRGRLEVIDKRTVREVSPGRGYIGRSRSVGPAPIIVDAHGPVRVVERSDNLSVGPLVVVDNRRKSDAVRAEIRALEALKADQAISIDLRKADRIRVGGRESGDLVIYEEKVKKEKDVDVVGIEIRKDKKAAQARAIATMMKTLT